MICGKWIFNMIKDATGVMISRDKRNSASRMLLIRCYMIWRTKNQHNSDCSNAVEMMT